MEGIFEATSRQVNICKRVLKICIGGYFLCLAIPAAAADGRSEECSGLLYRSKRDGVPVFDEPETTAAVVARLKIGEKVCWTGERGKFAIISMRLGTAETEARVVRYIKSTDLWPPRDVTRGDKRPGPSASPSSIIDSAKAHMRRMLQGLPAEDPLSPYRDVVDTNSNQQTSDRGDQSSSAATSGSP